MFILLTLDYKLNFNDQNWFVTSLDFFSGPNDRVFVYFADHGGTGLICFPYDDLYVDDLTNALKSMLKKKAFKEVNCYLILNSNSDIVLEKLF